RGRVRGVPDAEARLGRERLRLALLALLAARQHVAPAQAGSAAPEAAALRVRPRAPLRLHAADGGAAQAAPLPPDVRALRSVGRSRRLRDRLPALGRRRPGSGLPGPAPAGAPAEDLLRQRGGAVRVEG